MIENESIWRFQDGERSFTVVGTAHVSRESADLVQAVVEDERPDTVCLELCPSRYQSITRRSQWEETDLLKVIRQKKAFVLFSNLLLSHFQKRIGLKLGVRPGEEMLRAMDAAEAVGAGIHLADRDVRVTLTRAWRSMSWWSRIKLAGQLLFSLVEADSIREEDVESLKKQDALDALLQELGQSLPEIRRVLIDERDRYLARKIRTAPGERIVAVVGAGHLSGIRRHWDEDVDLDELERMPPPGRLGGIFKAGIPLLVVAVLVAGFFATGAAGGKEMLQWWILANAVLAGLGAAVALAHPLTILSAIVASPLTSLNPMIAAGWVSGLVETFLGKPKVRDFQSLPEDIASLKGFWKNKITRILLVVVFTNTGSALGSMVAVPLMLKVLAQA